jgi:hypothetical protein
MIQIGGFVHKCKVKLRKKVSIASLYLNPSATNNAAMAAIIKVNRYNFPRFYPLKSIIGKMKLRINI